MFGSKTPPPLTDAERQQIQSVMSGLLAGVAQPALGALTLLALVNRVQASKAAIIDIALESPQVAEALEAAILKHGPRFSDQLLARLENAAKTVREQKIKKKVGVV
jgi:hypothetical protein